MLRGSDQYRGKVAIVTGAASGIGRALSEALSRAGARVVLADINREMACQVAGTLAGPVRVFQVDVTDTAQVQELVNFAIGEFGRLDYMFNNAGFAVGGELRDMELHHWDRLIDVNFKGVVYGSMTAYQAMLKQGSGHIVNTASLAGLVPAAGVPAYSTTKMAVVGFSQNMRIEAAGLGIKVSAVCPGFVKTGLYDNATYLNTTKEGLLSILPIRLLEPERVAQIVLRGVRRNRAIIPVPGYAWLVWWTHRLTPNLHMLVHRVVAMKIRRKARLSKTESKVLKR